MSSGAQVAVLAPGGSVRPAASAAPVHGRVALTLTTFAALGLYGVARWATLLRSPPTGRLVALVAVAVAIAMLGEAARSRSRVVQIGAVAAVYAGMLAVLPLSGLPWRWTTHLQLARTLGAVRTGTYDLHNVLVPYGFESLYTRDVIVLGAGLLLLLGGLTLAAIRSGSGEARLVGAALPLVVLAVVPSALSTPRFAYLHGAVLFALLAAFVFSERVAPGRAVLASCAIAIAALGGMAIAPVFDRHAAWLQVDSLAGTNGPARPGELFDWSQTYGPLSWPHRGTVVLDVRAQQPYDWKAESLDMFDGRGWAQANVGPGQMEAQATLTPAILTRWLQTLAVSFRGMTSTNVIAGGYAFEPLMTGAEQTPIQNLQAGAVPGTWTTATPLRPGDSYQVRAYTPAPSGAALRRAGVNYPLPALRPELEMLVPTTRSPSEGSSRLPAQPVMFMPYGSRQPIARFGDLTAPQASSLLARSPYRSVYALAQELKRPTHTPYGFAEAVRRYLHEGYVYDTSTPAGRYPIVDFLLRTRRGYCQQFAGAMALLLRMGGVPARVAVGFATGVRVRHSDEYIVTDRDAHSWVEAWFPGYGWVQFDPTPPTPAVGRPSAGSREPGAQQSSRRALGQHTIRRPSGASALAGRSGGAGRAGLGAGAALALALLLAVALVAWGAWTLAHLRAARRGAEALLAELERAFALCGRPIGGGLTLEALERRVAADPDAAAYVRSIRLARFAPGAPAVSIAGRRALRRQLRDGLGLRGALRALVALPPLPRSGRTPAAVVH